MAFTLKIKNFYFKNHHLASVKTLKNVLRNNLLEAKRWTSSTRGLSQNYYIRTGYT